MTADVTSDAEVTVTGAPDPLPDQEARRSRLARLRRRTGATPVPDAAAPIHAGPSFEIAQNDPILGYCQSADGPVDITDLVLDSPGLVAMRAPASCSWSRWSRRAN